MTRQPIIAIDPGTTQSGVVVFDGQTIIQKGICDNESICFEMGRSDLADYAAIEMVAFYGMAVGADVFETCVQIGRFMEAWECSHKASTLTRIFRKDVKLTLCGSMRAKDANIRQALIDRFEPTGGGKCKQIGIKSQPGPLFGMKSHMWAALAVAVTWFELNPGTDLT